MLDKIKLELFVKGIQLTYTDDPNNFGRTTSIKELFYYQNEFGVFIYLPPLHHSTTVKLFDPIQPTSFRWCMFNRQLIYVPTSNVPFKKVFKVHPLLEDYIVRFNLEYYNRYSKVFVESNDIREDQFFLLRPDENYCVNLNNMAIKTGEELLDLSKNVTLKTVLVNHINVQPEFLNSNRISKEIREDNLDDVWKHWLAHQYGDRLLDPTDHYFKLCSNQEWVDKVVSHLVVQNLLEAEKPKELDPELKRLLGLA